MTPVSRKNRSSYTSIVILIAILILILILIVIAIGQIRRRARMERFTAPALAGAACPLRASSSSLRLWLVGLHAHPRGCSCERTGACVRIRRYATRVSLERLTYIALSSYFLSPHIPVIRSSRPTPVANHQRGRQPGKADLHRSLFIFLVPSYSCHPLFQTNASGQPSAGPSAWKD